jgi:hypothetical protein
LRFGLGVGVPAAEDDVAAAEVVLDIVVVVGYAK